MNEAAVSVVFLSDTKSSSAFERMYLSAMSNVWNVEPRIRPKSVIMSSVGSLKEIILRVIKEALNMELYVALNYLAVISGCPKYSMDCAKLSYSELKSFF